MCLPGPQVGAAGIRGKRFTYHGVSCNDRRLVEYVSQEVAVAWNEKGLRPESFMLAFAGSRSLCFYP